VAALPAAPPASAADATLTVADGALSYSGTDGIDYVFVYLEADYYRVSTYPIATVTGCKPTRYPEEVKCPAAAITRMTFRFGPSRDELGVGSNETGEYPVAVTAFGGGGKDYLIARAAASATLYGGARSDFLDGGRGDDQLIGGPGADLLLGRSGGDNLVGEAGSDSFYGNRGPDVIRGGDDTDEVRAGPGADRIVTDDAYADDVRCGTGSDSVDSDLSDVVAADCESVS
jgi:Ca2+-binding RTX toxin-like protein